MTRPFLCERNDLKDFFQRILHFRSVCCANLFPHETSLPLALCLGVWRAAARALAGGFCSDVMAMSSEGIIFRFPDPRCGALSKGFLGWHFRGAPPVLSCQL